MPPRQTCCAHASICIPAPSARKIHELQDTRSVLLTSTLHAQYDAEGAGKIHYKDLMSELLELDQLALYALHES